MFKHSMYTTQDGRPHYLSIESDIVIVSKKTEIFSLGCLFYLLALLIFIPLLIYLVQQAYIETEDLKKSILIEFSSAIFTFFMALICLEQFEKRRWLFSVGVIIVVAAWIALLTIGLSSTSQSFLLEFIVGLSIILVMDFLLIMIVSKQVSELLQRKEQELEQQSQTYSDTARDSCLWHAVCLDISGNLVGKFTFEGELWQDHFHINDEAVPEEKAGNKEVTLDDEDDDDEYDEEKPVYRHFDFYELEIVVYCAEIVTEIVSDSGGVEQCRNSELGKLDKNLIHTYAKRADLNGYRSFSDEIIECSWLCDALLERVRHILSVGELAYCQEMLPISSQYQVQLLFGKDSV